MANENFSTEIRSSFGKNYLKVFFADDSCAENTYGLIVSLNEVLKANISDYIGKVTKKSLTIYPNPMFDIKAMEKAVINTLNVYFSGVTEKKTDIKSSVEFKDIEQKILDALSEANATIDVSVAWFTNETLMDKLLEMKNKDCKVRVMIDANYTNTKHGVDLSPFEHKAIKAERNGIMHRKFCVIDNNVLIHGSYNWTTNAETRNDEEISVDRNDVKKASLYTKEFNRLWDKND